jgi:opacity protein-like surface antigen
MRISRCVFAVLLFLSVAALNTSAQFSPSGHEFEVTPFGGTRFGGQIQFNPPATYTNGTTSETVDYIGIKSSIDYGLYADYSIWPSFQAEFMWNRQPTEFRAHNADTGGLSNIGSANLDMYQFGALWEFRSDEAKLRPFAVFGLGFTHFGDNNILQGMSNRFSYSIGGGVKYNLASHVGLRLDVRYSPTHTTQQNGYAYDYYYGGSVPVTYTNKANQGQANIGVIFKF